MRFQRRHNLKVRKKLFVKKNCQKVVPYFKQSIKNEKRRNFISSFDRNVSSEESEHLITIYDLLT
jgi:hypothetical protein